MWNYTVIWVLFTLFELHVILQYMCHSETETVLHIANILNVSLIDRSSYEWAACSIFIGMEVWSMLSCILYSVSPVHGLSCILYSVSPVTELRCILYSVSPVPELRCICILQAYVFLGPKQNFIFYKSNLEDSLTSESSRWSICITCNQSLSSFTKKIIKKWTCAQFKSRAWTFIQKQAL